MIEITYALPSDQSGRPLQVQVNGGTGGQGGQGGRTGFTAHFPGTGSWDEWGTIRHRVDLLSGHNTITLTAKGNSGPNIDTLEVYPNGDAAIGHWRGNMDNSGTFYVNGQAINDPAVTGWDKTNTFSFTQDCSTPTVYAFHAMDGEVSEEGTSGVGGVVGSITHCNEVIITSAAWKCIATDLGGRGYGIPQDWKAVDFDDALWEKAKQWGRARRRRRGRRGRRTKGCDNNNKRNHINGTEDEEQLNIEPQGPQRGPRRRPGTPTSSPRGPHHAQHTIFGSN